MTSTTHVDVVAGGPEPGSPTGAGMAPEALGSYLAERLGERITDTDVSYGQLTVTVQPDAVPDVVRLCKEDDALGFDFFDFMSGVDLGDEGFAVITHLYSTTHYHHVSVRAVCPGGRDEPTLPSISHIYRGANWHERETYDMFGIVFEGHPGLEPRILTVENFEGWPLRKDFLLSSREAKPWPGLKEPKEVDADADEPEAAKSVDTDDAEEKARQAKERAERARRKAAEMRAQKARERAAAEQPPEGGDQQEREAEEGNES